VKGAGFQWVRIPPGSWSLQPVAIGAAVEVTKPSEPSMERVAIGDSASKQAAGASERRAGLERSNVDADPLCETGKADAAGLWRATIPCRSTEVVGDGMFARGNQRNTGSLPWRRRVTANWTPARDRPGLGEVTERFVVVMKPGNAGGATRFSAGAPENPSSASTRCMTRCTARMCCRWPCDAAATTAASQASTARPSRTLRSTARRSG
jgi:hypothetical protein